MSIWTQDLPGRVIDIVPHFHILERLQLLPASTTKKLGEPVLLHKARLEQQRRQGLYVSRERLAPWLSLGKSLRRGNDRGCETMITCSKPYLAPGTSQYIDL